MSDWMSGPHKAQRTVPIEVAPDPEPVELTDPVDVIAWLRALPVGTVLLDSARVAWQLHLFARNLSAVPADGWGESHNLGRDDHARSMADHAPFRVLWRPGGAT